MLIFRILRLSVLSIVGGFLFGDLNASGAIRLPRMFSSHMVLQQQKPIIIWGWAEPNEKISVQISSSKASTTANALGEWKVSLKPLKAAGPFVLNITGSEAIRLDDVMIGEVWLCSGQSNMEMGINQVENAKEEIAAAHYSRIRLLMVPNHWSPEALTNIDETTWKVCSPETVAEGGWGGFSAAAYFFGRELHKELGVAVGLIDSDWGGTRIESWTPPEGFAAVPVLKAESERVDLGNPHSSAHRERLAAVLKETESWVASAREAMDKQSLVPPMPSYPPDLLPPHDVQNATALYNGMIHPLVPFAIRGAIWYQGESNLGDGKLYADRMKALIAGWRKIWKEGDFPFYYVQIAPYNYGGSAERMGEFWEGQASVQAVPGTGMAVINDIGNLKDIHPKNKQAVGHRLALLALARTYGKDKLVASGPTFKAMKIEGAKLRLTFDNVADGLKSRDSKPLSWFEVIDAEEGGFVPAKAEIEGAEVVLSADAVPHPIAMRFAWSMLAEPNLMNSAGLPAGAFRAGDVPPRDTLAMQVPESKQYQVVYDLDLNTLGATIRYATNNAKALNKPFDRIAYCLELQHEGAEPEFVYASMDAFTDDLKKIAIPTAQSGARFQQKVTHLNVYSNAKNVTTGVDLSGGNIEFWPNNYGPANSAKIPHASNDVYDFGDEPGDPKDGYGSMQIHNHNAKQTLFAINHWKEGAKADVGIGNQPTGNADWTFAANAASVKMKRLRVLVRTK